jgi:hypothetical protein
VIAFGVRALAPVASSLGSYVLHKRGPGAPSQRPPESLFFDPFF